MTNRTTEPNYDVARDYISSVLAVRAAADKDWGVAAKALDSMLDDIDGERCFKKFVGSANDEKDIEKAAMIANSVLEEERENYTASQMTEFYSFSETEKESAERLFNQGMGDKKWGEFQDDFIRAKTIYKNKAGFSEDEITQAERVIEKSKDVVEFYQRMDSIRGYEAIGNVEKAYSEDVRDQLLGKYSQE
jgi:hypothetical protein